MKYLLFSILPLIVLPHFASAAESARLPYLVGERFVVSTGFSSPPTHVGKDNYAIDFTQDGCNAYGKPAVAAFSGTAWVVQKNGYNGGYGAQILVLSEGNVVARYAHLIPGSIPVDVGDAISQGMVIGEIGNTGLVQGTACTEHPGTHIHFAMDTRNTDGGFTAKNPEPISAYEGIKAGKWYLSDNALAATKGNLVALIEIVNDLLGNKATNATPSSSKNISSHASSTTPKIARGAARTVSEAVIPALTPVKTSSPAIPAPSSAEIPPVVPRTIPDSVPSSVAEKAPTVPVSSFASAGGPAAGGSVSISIPVMPQAITHATAASGMPDVGQSLVHELASTTADSASSSVDDPSADDVEACVL